jgi:hypothetical protein
MKVVEFIERALDAFSGIKIVDVTPKLFGRFLILPEKPGIETVVKFAETASVNFFFVYHV